MSGAHHLSNGLLSIPIILFEYVPIGMFYTVKTNDTKINKNSFDLIFFAE